MTISRPRPWRALIVLVVLLVSTGSVRAFGGRRDLRGRLQQLADDAFGKVKASPAQRERLRPVLDEILRTAEDAFGSEPGALPETDELLRIFAAEPLDVRALTRIRDRRDRRHKQLADALVKAIHEIHAALDPAQRARLCDYALGKGGGKRGRAIKEKIISSLVRSQLEDLLGQLPATEAEHQVVNGLRDRLVGALFAARAERGGRLEALSAAFRADTLDHDAVDKLRAVEEQRLGELTALIERAFTELHAAMSPQHRARLAELIRDLLAHRPHAAPQAGGEPF